MSVVCKASLNPGVMVAKDWIIPKDTDMGRRLPLEAVACITSFLPKYMEVNVENMSNGSFCRVLEGLFWSSPNAAFYKGKRYEIDQIPLNYGVPFVQNPDVPPTVFPDNTLDAKGKLLYKVTYEHNTSVIQGRRITHHDSVVFVGKTVCLCRGRSNDGFGNDIVMDQCELSLAVTGPQLIKNPFTLQELLDGHWAIHFVKGCGVYDTEPSIGASYVYDGILTLEINWGYGS